MNVLSLFDGISCGQIALQRAGIKVDQYFASEIDKHAIKVTQHNWPDTVQLGSVVDVKAENLPKIDLLIAGSPCQGFSFAGKQLNFNDPRSKLFFEFTRLLDEIKERNPEVKFLLENVKMKKESESVITQKLEVRPIEINSSLVSAQNRRRLYWTNISNIELPKDRGIFFYNIINNTIIGDKSWYEKRIALKRRNVIQSIYDQKSACLQTQSVFNPLLKELYRYLTPEESEQLQTLPCNYTSLISKTQRIRSIGNGWTVDVIAHIFKNLK